AGNRTCRTRDCGDECARVRRPCPRSIANPGIGPWPRRVCARDLLDSLLRPHRCVGVRAGAALSDVRAIVTGAGGQDGSYLAELLLERGDEGVGIVRAASRAYPNLAGVRDRLQLVQADMLDRLALTAVLREYAPREV